MLASMPKTEISSFPHRRQGMGSSETLIAAAAIGIVVVIAALTTSTIQDELKTRQTRDMLWALEQALDTYHRSTGHWPAPPRPADARLDPGRNLTAELIATLKAVPESREKLESIPAILRSTQDEQSDTVRDAWGHPLRCLTADSPSEIDRRVVAANGGRPVFISAGPDGDFGELSLPATADNIRLQPAPQRGP